MGKLTKTDTKSQSAKSVIAVVKNAKDLKTLKSTTKKGTKLIINLASGITGKQLMKIKCDANSAHKKDLGTISYCIKRAKLFGADFFAEFSDYNGDDLTPKNLLPHRTEYQKTFKNFSVWGVLGMAKKFYTNKAAKVTNTKQIKKAA